jgi:hypothetical protein
MRLETKMNTLILRGKHLLEKSGAANMHQLSLKIQMSVPTVHRYLAQPERVKAMDLNIFARLVMRSQNLTERQFLAMKIGDLFEFVKEPESNK